MNFYRRLAARGYYVSSMNQPISAIAPGTGSPEAVARLRLPHYVVCRFPLRQPLTGHTLKDTASTRNGLSRESHRNSTCSVSAKISLSNRLPGPSNTPTWLFSVSSAPRGEKLLDKLTMPPV
jgi:hypothetical protein